MFARSSLTLLFTVLFAVILASPAVAQRSVQRLVHIDSNAPNAVVYMDSIRVGVVQDAPFSVPDTVKQVVVVLSETGLWNVAPLTFDLLPDETKFRLDAQFDYHYQLESIPSGADVSIDGDNLGLTPLSLQRSTPFDSEVLFALEGYTSVRSSLKPDVWSRTVVKLELLDGHMANEFELDLKPRKWINYVAATTSLVAGILAIHLRTKADNRFENYNETGDNALKERIKRLDVQSGISLGVMQVGIGVIAFRIAF